MALRNSADGAYLSTGVSLWSLNVSSYTVTGWFRLDTRKDWATAWAFEAGTNLYDILYLNNDSSNGNQCRLYTDWGSNAQAGSSSATLTEGLWYYIACSRTAGASGATTIYLAALGAQDLTSYSQSVSTNAPTTLTSFSVLDNIQYTGENGNCTAAHIKLFDRVLTAAEIREERFRFFPKARGNLKYWNPLNNLQQARDDFSGQGRVMSVTGTPTHELGPPIQFIDLPTGYSRQANGLILLPTTYGQLPANFGAAAGGPATITGDGALSADAATITGTAERSITGTGALASQAATVAGTAERSVTGTGALSAAASTIAGTAERSVTGTGALASTAATVAGTAERSVTGTGALSAQAATVDGTAERSVTGTGALASQAATIAGTGAVGDVIIGDGALAAQSATISGTAEREIVGTGSLAAQAGTIDGTAERSVTGTGALSAQASTVSGVAVRIITGTGALTAQAATVSGDGTVITSGTVSGSGNLAANDATMDGTGDVIHIAKPGAGSAKARRAKPRRVLVEPEREEQEREQAEATRAAAPEPKRARRTGKASRGIQLQPDDEAQEAAAGLAQRTAELIAAARAQEAQNAATLAAAREAQAMLEAAVSIEAENEMIMLLLMAA